jgi:hypothetical protein
MSSQPKSQDFIVPDGEQRSSDSDDGSQNVRTALKALKTGQNESLNYLCVGSSGISAGRCFRRFIETAADKAHPNSIHTSQVSLCPDSHCLCRSKSVFVCSLKRKPRGFECDCWLRSDKPEPKVLDVLRGLGPSLRRLVQQRRVTQFYVLRE